MAQKKNTTNYAATNTRRRPGGNAPANNDKQPQRPKKQDMQFLVATEFLVEDRQNNSQVEIDAQIIYDALQSLLDTGAFDMLTQNVSMARSTMNHDPEAKGNAVIGFIKDFNFSADKPTVTLTVYGASVGPVQDLTMTGTKLILQPRLVCNKGEFKCFNGFFLVAEE